MQYPDINPNMLKYARESMVFDLKTAAKKLGIKDSKNQTAIEKLQSMEIGQLNITHSILQKAVNYYKRPLIYFYLDSIPHEDTALEDFRSFSNTFPKKEKDEALLRALIRDIKLKQNLVSNVLEEEEAEPFSLPCKIDINYRRQDAAALIIDEMKFHTEEYRNTRTITESFEYLRSKIEATGIFVLLLGDLGSCHTRIETETFRGIASDSKFAPFIVINNYDAKVNWLFTLLTELVHLLIGKPGISNNIILPDAPIPKDGTENFCENVAAEILFSDQKVLLIEKGDIKNEKKQNDSRRNALKRHKLGNRLLGIVKHGLDSGIMQPTKAATVLGVPAVSVHEFLMRS